MNRDKQIDTPTESQYTKRIEERSDLAEIIYMSGYGLYRNDSLDIAEQIQVNGYHKASEVAEEIFAEIDNLLYKDERDFDDLMDSETVAEVYQEYLACSNYLCGVRQAIAELKKKYAEDTE